MHDADSMQLMLTCIFTCKTCLEKSNAYHIQRTCKMWIELSSRPGHGNVPSFTWRSHDHSGHPSKIKKINGLDCQENHIHSSTSIKQTRRILLLLYIIVLLQMALTRSHPSHTSCTLHLKPESHQPSSLILVCANSPHCQTSRLMLPQMQFSHLPHSPDSGFDELLRICIV